MTRTTYTARISVRNLDQRITLQRQLPGQDGLGEVNGAWVDVQDVFAQAQPLRGRELFNAAQMQASVDVRFVVRWRDDIDATWRVLWRGVAHEITAPPIDVDGQQQWLELMCTAGIRNG